MAMATFEVGDVLKCVQTVQNRRQKVRLQAVVSAILVEVIRPGNGRRNVIGQCPTAVGGMNELLDERINSKCDDGNHGAKSSQWLPQAFVPEPSR